MKGVRPISTRHVLLSIRWLSLVLIVPSFITTMSFLARLSKYHHVPMHNNSNHHQRNKICFIQSVFGDGNHPSSLDRPKNVSTLYHRDDDDYDRHDGLEYEFFYFTNLPDLPTPEWTKIVLPDSKMGLIQRHITISRLPKFLAWKIEPRIQKECIIVMYMDGHFYPRPNKHSKLQRLAKSVIQSKYGLLHVTHPKGGLLTDEFDRIVSGTKDTQAHVDASLAWLTSQPDWSDNATLYWNAVFAYDPWNDEYRKASEFFWNRYSQELDSWRDQPLWAYTLHHFGIQPLTMRHDTLHSTIYEDFNLKGDHHYADDKSVTYVKSSGVSGR